MKYQNQKEYSLHVVGLTRKLPIIEIEKNKLWIASFVMLGDTELNYRCAKQLSTRIASDIDYLVVPEAKAIPLTQSIGQILNKDYIVLRKGIKSYMKDCTEVKVKSITTSNNQLMVLNGSDAEKIKGKLVCIIDDVVSTGESFRSMLDLMSKAGAKIGFAATVLREGKFDISDIEKRIGMNIFYLSELPIFEQ